MTDKLVSELEEVLPVLTAEDREEVFTFALDLQDIGQTAAPVAADRQAWSAPHTKDGDIRDLLFAFEAQQDISPRSLFVVFRLCIPAFLDRFDQLVQHDGKRLNIFGVCFADIHYFSESRIFNFLFVFGKRKSSGQIFDIVWNFAVGITVIHGNVYAAGKIVYSMACGFLWGFRLVFEFLIR